MNLEGEKMARNDFSSNYLMHHGILGMKWGIRNYQNKDGTLTDAGRARYGVGEGKGVNDISSAKGIKRRLNDLDKAIARNKAKRGSALAKVNSKMWKSQNAKNASKAEKHTEMIKKGEEETKKLLKKAAEKGYDVSSKATLRNVSSGVEIIGRSLLASGLATSMLLPFGRAAFIPSWSSVSGKEYNVKDTEKKDRKETAKKEEKISKYNSTNEMFADLKRQRESQPLKTNQEKLKDVEQRIKNSNWKQNKDGTWDWKGDPNVSEIKRDHDFEAFMNILDERRELKEKRDKTNRKAAVEKGLADNKKQSSSSKSSGLSDKTIKSRIEYAKKTGKFDMEFLERVDRYVDEDNHSQAAMLKGYEEYLKEHGDEFYKKK